MPTAIASTVESIRDLSDFRPKPMHILGNPALTRPSFTSGSTKAVFFAPGDIKVAYDFPLSGTGETGTGQSIAIMGQSAVQVSDLEDFQNAAGLSVKDPTMVLVPGTGISTETQKVRILETRTNLTLISSGQRNGPRR